MPSKPPTPCSTPGCPNDTSDRHCADCESEQNRRRREREQQSDDDQPTTAERGYDGTWQKLRKRYLADHPLCERCKRRGDTTPAEEVHHVIPIREDQSERLKRRNLEALCKSCHARATKREDQFSRPETVLVCGPAGSGKTSYVRAQRSVGDLIVDVDLIWRALGMLPMYLKPNEMTDAVLRTREFVLDYIRRPSQLDRAWIIATAADPQKRAKLEQHIRAGETRVLTVDAETCKDRIRSDDSRQRHLSHHLALVDEWWSEYEPRSGEREIQP